MRASRGAKGAGLALVALAAACAGSGPQIHVEIRDLTTVRDTETCPRGECSPTEQLTVLGTVAAVRDSAEVASSGVVILKFERAAGGDPTVPGRLRTNYLPVLLQDGRGAFKFPDEPRPLDADWTREQLILVPLGVFSVRPLAGIDFAVRHAAPGESARWRVHAAATANAFLALFRVQEPPDRERRWVPAQAIAAAVVANGKGDLMNVSSGRWGILGLGGPPPEGSAFTFLGAIPIVGTPELRVQNERVDSSLDAEPDAIMYRPRADALLVGDSLLRLRPALAFFTQRQTAGGRPGYDTSAFYVEALMLHGGAALNRLIGDGRPKNERWPAPRYAINPVGIIPLIPVSGRPAGPW
jgi:hypothetical protein